ncbi:MAG: peptidylprolyl isomerase, partial [Proteobacteria bacterium]|nr:peptidylprolyl isomerase [Pseudomonadota bacterium]
MITDMRDSVSSWPVRILLIVLVLTFVSFYGLSSSGPGQLNQGEVANVNGESIKATDFSLQFQNLVQSYQKQGRLPQDVPEGLYSILKQQLLASMIYQKLKSSEAKKAGLVASNEEVKSIIKKQFSDPEGKFDFKFYEGYLRNQMGKTPGQYEELQRENIRADLFEQLILETGLASNLQLKDSYKQTNEKVSLSYVRLNEKNTAAIRPKAKAGTTEELKKYFEENSSEFKTKEAREMDIAYYEKSAFKGSNFEKDAQKKLQEYVNQNTDISSVVGKDKELRHIATGMVGYEDKISNLTSTEATEVLNATSNLDAGKNTILVSRDGSKVFLIKLLKSRGAEVPTFESVRTQVEKSYASIGDKEAFVEWMNSTWKDIADGKMTLEAFAKKIGSSVKNTESFSKSASGLVPEIGANPIAMNEAFNVTQANPFFKDPIRVDDDYVFMKLRNKSDPDWKKFEAENDNLANALHKESAQN